MAKDPKDDSAPSISVTPLLSPSDESAEGFDVDFESAEADLFASFNQRTCSTVEHSGDGLPPGQAVLTFEEDEVSELIAAGLRETDASLGVLIAPQAELPTELDGDLENLNRLYGQKGLWSELITILESRAAVTDKEGRVAYLLELARTLEAQAGDLERAIATYQRVLDLLPTCERAFSRLVALRTRRGQWLEVLEACEAYLAHLTTPAQRLPVLEAIADVYEHQLGKRSNALAISLRAIIDEGPDPGLIRRLARLASLTGTWGDVMTQLSRGAVTSEDRTKQSDLFRVMGTYYLDRLDLPQHAVTCFGQALLRNPHSPGSASSLASSIHACLDRGRIAELCAILPRLNSSTLPVEFIDRLATHAVAMHRRGEGEPAKQFLTALLQLVPEDEALFSALCSMLEAERAFEKLHSLHRERIARAPSPQVRRQRQLALIDVLEHVMCEPKRAMDGVMQMLAEANYADDELGRQVARMATTYECWDDLLSTCVETLGLLPESNPKAKGGLCRLIGLWYVRHLQSAEAAIPLLRSSLLFEPDEVSTWQLLAEVQRLLGHHSDLAEALSEAAAREDDPNRKAEVLMDLGKVLEVQLQDVPNAIVAYTSCIELDPTSRWASTALQRLCPDEAHELLIERAVTSRLRLTNAPTELAALHLRLAELYANQPERMSSAVDHCRSALDSDPNSEVALLLLERIYIHLGHYDAVVDTLQARLGRVTSQPLQVWLLLRIAEILTTEIHDSDRAATAYEQVLEMEPRNEPALRALAETYRRNGRHEDLSRVLERLVLTARTEHRRLELLRELSRLYLHHLKDLSKAGEVFGELGNIDVEDADLLSCLASTHEHGGKLGLAVEALIRLATLTREPPRRAEVLARIGRICADRLNEYARAAEYFETALELSPQEPAYLESLIAIEEKSESWPKVVELLNRLIECPAADDLRSARLVRLGDVLKTQLNDDQGATACFEKARSLCPTNHDATNRLLDVYELRGDHEEFEKSLRQLVHSGLASGAILRDWYKRLACACERRHDEKAALEALQASFDIDSRDTDSLLALASARFAAQHWDRALRLYTTAITDRRHSRGAQSLALAYFRAGVCQKRLAPNDLRKAEGFFAKAVELDPRYRDALDAIVASAKQRGDKVRTAEYLLKLCEIVDEPEERRKLLLELADVYESLRESAAAVATYRKALEILSMDRGVLHKLALLLRASRNWTEYEATMERLAVLSATPEERAEVLYDLACTLLDKARNRRRAQDFLEKALDASPMMPRAFEHLEEILTKRKDWAGLERVYTGMLNRIDPSTEPLLASNLWQVLGELYQARLENRVKCIEAFEQSVQLAPDDPMLRRKLAQQYATSPANLCGAEEQLRWLICDDPHDIEAYEMLWSAYQEAGRIDECICASAPLVFLERADARQRESFDAGRSRVFDLLSKRLERERWPQMLGDGTAFEPIVRVLEAVSPSALSRASKPPRAYGMSPSQRSKTRKDAPVASLFHRIVDVLGIDESVELYLQEGDTGGLSYAHTEPRASICPEGALRSYNQAQLIFLLARHLFYYPNRHYVRWLAPSRQGLETLLLAAIGTVDPLQLPAAARESSAVRRLADSLRSKMNSGARQRLNLAVEQFVHEGARIDLEGWFRHLELMSTRLGFVLCNDLFTAAQICRADAGEPYLSTANERI
ncbi:MAG: tetratricopeptide repeat protein, partial [Myxococcota bacterium]|nr:tetratricopeptide repeat protein [Myxococcota bacterium]